MDITTQLLIEFMLLTYAITFIAILYGVWPRKITNAVRQNKADHARVRKSIRLSSLLRHGDNGRHVGIVGPNGYALCKEVEMITGVTFEEMKEITAMCPKKRFDMVCTIGGWYIRANQGHHSRMKVDPDLLFCLLAEEDVERFCVHATLKTNVDSILANGLSVMKRTSIHLVEGIVDWTHKHLSGVRNRSDTLITVDVHAAMRDGIKFYRSSNDVILTSGINGILPSKYIVRVAEKQIEIVPGAKDLVQDARAFITATGPQIARTVVEVGNLAATAQPVVNKMNVAADKMAETTALANDTLESIKNVFDFGLKHNVVSRVMSVFKVLVNCMFARDGMKLYSLLFNIMCEFGADAVKGVSQLVGAKEAVRQIDLEALTGLASEFQTKVGENREVTGGVLAIVVAFLLQLALGLPNTANPDKLLKFYGDRSRNLKNITDFGKSATGIFSDIGDWITDQISPGVKKQGLDDYVSGYQDWTKDILDLMRVEEPVAVRMQKDKKLVFTIDRLYKKGVEYSMIVKTLKVDGSFVAHYQKMFKIIEEMRKQCDYTGVFGNKPRCKPLVVHLFGESGVGKSGMTWPLASDLNAVFSDTLESAKDFASEVYFRNVEQEFWDGYSGQRICIYDDFGQMTDSSTNPNVEFMEIIRAGNLAPYPLHMANLEEKKRTKFVSQAIILTSNVLELKVNSLTFPDAYRRRVDLCAKITIKPEFSKDGFSAERGEIVARLDRDKCDGPCDTRPYLVNLYDPETKSCVTPKKETPNPPEWMDDNALTYDEFLDMAINKARVALQDSMLFNDKLDVRIDEARFNKLRAIYAQRQIEDINIHWNKDLDMTELTHVEAPTSALRDALKRVSKFKTALVLVALILGGLGIWKMISKQEKKKRQKHVTQFLEHDVLSAYPVLLERDFKDNLVEGSASADLVTRKLPTNVREAGVSADSVTRKNPTNVREASASADSVTRKNPTTVREASASADSVTRRMPVVKREALETAAELQAWKDKTAQELISYRILSNLYHIHVDGASALNGLFVRDRVMLVPMHLRDFLANAGSLSIWNAFGSKFEVPMSEITFSAILSSDGEHKDAMLMRFPRYVNAHSDLVKHFQTMPELAVRRVDVCVPTLRIIRDQPMCMILGNAVAKMEERLLNFDGELTHMRDAIVYNLNTKGGDCGGPIVCNDTSFIRKIAGIHIAATPDGKEAFGQSVTQKDLLNALQRFSDTIVTDFDMLPNLEITPVNLQVNVEHTLADLQKIFDMPGHTFGFVGKCNRLPSAPLKSDIEKSVIHGYSEPKTKPAYLRHPTENILYKNMEKCAVNTPFIPQDEIDRAVNEVAAKLLSSSTFDKRLRKVFSFEEAIAGSLVSEYVGGITRQTSPGYPWVFDRKSGKPGKTTWLGDDAYIFDEDVRAAVEYRLSLAKQGIRCPTVWNDCLKDERRPIAKVDALKTRVFAFGPMDYTILFRMYFIGFIAHIMENKITNEQSVGTDPYGIDWARTAKKLQVKGKRVFAGDFSTFDGTLNSCIMAQFASVANKFYNDGPENALVREVLMREVFNSVHLCGDKFISLTHSQPSGNPLTTVLNSFYNSVSMRISFYRVCPNDDFETHVSMVSYGDDNVVNISDEISCRFNQNSATEAYASFGMTYTDEAKTGGEVAPYRLISEVNYLKRRFVQDGAFWRCPNDMTTILETPNWVRKSPDSVLATEENVKNSVMELAQYPLDHFERYSSLMIDAFYAATGMYPSVKTWAQYRREWNEAMVA